MGSEEGKYRIHLYECGGKVKGRFLKVREDLNMSTEKNQWKELDIEKTLQIRQNSRKVDRKE